MHDARRLSSEHLGLALALNVPVFVVITKIDMCPANVLEDTLQLLQKILKSPGCRKMPLMVSTMDDVIVTASNFASDRFVFVSFVHYLFFLGRHAYVAVFARSSKCPT
jgi:GTPase